MTLIVAIPAEDGVIFGSDCQVTTGPVRATSTKISQLNKFAVWGASGDLALIQRVGERLGTLTNVDQPLIALRDVLAQIVKDSVQALLTTDFRTQFVAQNPEMLLQLHPGDFLFVECRQTPQVLHIMANGTPEWVQGRVTATGNGELFAHALLRKYAGVKLTRDQAKLLAFKVIEEAIEVGAYGLGPPIDIWDVGASGVTHVSEGESAALDDAARMLREQEVSLLTGNGAIASTGAPAQQLRRRPSRGSHDS